MTFLLLLQRYFFSSVLCWEADHTLFEVFSNMFCSWHCDAVNLCSWYQCGLIAQWVGHVETGCSLLTCAVLSWPVFCCVDSSSALNLPSVRAVHAACMAGAMLATVDWCYIAILGLHAVVSVVWSDSCHHSVAWYLSPVFRGYLTRMVCLKHDI